MSIFKRKDNGKWRVQICYKTIDGQNKRFSATAKTRKQAVEMEAAYQKEINNIASPKITLNTLTILFLDKMKGELRLSTIDDYKKRFKLILPYFNEKTIDKITVSDIAMWKAEIENKNYSLTYKKSLYKTLKHMFRFASSEYDINNNSIMKVSNFKPDPNKLIIYEQKLNYWNMEQFQAWLNAIKKDVESADKKTKRFMILESVKVLIAILMLAGLRIGEANALQVKDFIDGEYPYLKVNKSVTHKIKGIKELVTNPKTISSIRDVPIPDFLASEIRTHIGYLKKIRGYSKNFYLCGGIHTISDWVATKYKNHYEELAHIPHIRIHDLRHSYVSLLINSGVDIQVISNLVGHSSSKITMSVYSHMYPKTKNSAIEKLNILIRKE